MVPGPEFYWHATPLLFLPAILTEGALRASANPRPSARARRRKLGLDGYLHFSFASKTPLLADKLKRGYPHALLAFDPVVGNLPGAAYLKWNTKRWAHREEFIPITDLDEKAAFLGDWCRGKYPSAELLVPERLALTYATNLYFASKAEADWLQGFSLSTPPIMVSPERFPPGPEPDLAPLQTWFEACRAAGELLPPPELPFD